jgi:O-antigen/teichoic acid export membrane protein
VRNPEEERARAATGRRSTRRLASDGTLHIVVGSVVGGIGVYTYEVVGARALGGESFAPVSVLLTIHFLVFVIVLIPVEQFLIRRLTISGGARGTGRTVAGPVVGLGLLSAAAGGGYALATLDRNFDGSIWYAAAAVGVVLSHTVFVVARAYLAGRRRFAAYGVSSAAASLLRLALAVPLVLVAASGLGLSWIMAAAPLIVLAWRPFASTGRPPPTAHEEAPGRFLAGFVLASAASQALILAGPLLASEIGAAKATVSIVFATFTLFRAPIAFGYNIVARVLPPFTRLAAEGRHDVLRRYASLMGGTGALLAPAALGIGYGLGPAVVSLVFGPEFRPTAALAAMVAAGVVLAGTSMFVGQILIARGRIAYLAGAWVIGVGVAAAALLAAGWAPETRVGIGFIAGETAALAALLAGARGGPVSDP